MSYVNINKKGWNYRWTKEEDGIIQEFYPKHGYNKVLEFLPHRNKKGVQQRASKIGVSYLRYNKNYFSNINTKEKAYWLGFLSADGYVTTDNRFGMELSIRDISHMQLFLDDLEYNGNISTRTRNNGKTSCQFQIKNSKLYKDLLMCGITREKTMNLSFPRENILTIDLYPHFIRGFFDGDGSFIFYEYDRIRKDRNNKIYKGIYKEISLVCGSAVFLEEMKNIIFEQCGAKFNFTINSRDKLPTLRTSSSDNLVRFIEYIYPTENETHLERKYKKAQEILKYCLV